MKSNANGISPVVCIILTLLVAALTVWMFAKSHVFWGIVFALICVDFLADVILSFKKA